MRKLRERVKFEDMTAQLQVGDRVQNGKYYLKVTAVGETRCIGLNCQGKEQTMLYTSIVRWNGRVVL